MNDLARLREWCSGHHSLVVRRRVEDLCAEVEELRELLDARGGEPLHVRFGENRRQNPLEVYVPGGQVTFIREKHGTVRVTLSGNVGEVQRPTSAAIVCRLLHEASEPEGEE